jgi:tetratricopeptide (TPR) repeat protein
MERAIEIDPVYAESWYNKGETFRQRDRYKEAIGCFEKAVLIDPNYVRAWNSIGFVFMAAGRKREADAAFARAGMQ